MTSRTFIKTLRAIALLAALAAGAVILGACDKDPLKPLITPPRSSYPVPRSPAIVLQNLVAAYNSRDSVEIGALYDVNYQGSSTGPSQPNLSFTRADEIHHVHRLKNDPNIVNVSLDLGPPYSWVRYGGNVTDPPGTAVIPIPYFALTVTDISSGSVYSAQASTIEFAFKPTPSAQYDTTWTVIRWTEVGN